MKVTVRSLIAYYDCISKKLNQGKCLLLFPPIYIFLKEVAPDPVDKHRLEGLVISLMKKPQRKSSHSFMDLRAQGQKKRKNRSGKVLSTESEWRKVSSEFPPHPLL